MPQSAVTQLGLLDYSVFIKQAGKTLAANVVIHHPLQASGLSKWHTRYGLKYMHNWTLHKPATARHNITLFWEGPPTDFWTWLQRFVPIQDTKALARPSTDVGRWLVAGVPTRPEGVGWGWGESSGHESAKWVNRFIMHLTFWTGVQKSFSLQLLPRSWTHPILSLHAAALTALMGRMMVLARTSRNCPRPEACKHALSSVLLVPLVKTVW